MTKASAFNPPWKTEFSPVVGSIVVRVLDRKVGLITLALLPVLGVDPKALQIPDHDLITLAVVHIQDTLAAPVGGGKDLKTSVLTQVVAYADSLTMTVDRALEDGSIRGEEHEALPAGNDGDKVAVVLQNL